MRWYIMIVRCFFWGMFHPRATHEENQAHATEMALWFFNKKEER